VIYPAFVAAGVRFDEQTEAAASQRAVARELDHAAHLALLDELDAAFARDAIAAVALKGPLLAERLYSPTPSVRVTSDVDILVAENDLERAMAALAAVGYVPREGPDEERYRREHHHLHLFHPNALPLELHFHAYRGFGRVLPAEPLIARRMLFIARGYRALGVLSAPDELVYLAVHAAAHRFERLGWLWDIKLLLERMTPAEVMLGAERAEEWGYARVMAFTGELLVDVLGVNRERVAPFSSVDGVARALARRTVRAPAWPPARAATRFIYTTALCDTRRAASEYALAAISARVRSAMR
jgi:hypothetical protein